MKKKIFYSSSKKGEIINIKEEIFKYLGYWPYFIISIILFCTATYIHLKYKTVTYKTTGKIKILDEKSKSLDITSDITTLLDGSKVNLENEIQILKSHLLLENVVSKLNLRVQYFDNDKIKNKEIWNSPFKITHIKDSLLTNAIYTLKINTEGYTITNDNLNWEINSHNTTAYNENLPFLIDTKSEIIKKHIGKTYTIKINNFKKTTNNLASKIAISQVGKSSEVLELSVIDENIDKSEAIINEIIKQFNFDGIVDRQRVSQRTIDFVNERFLYLSKELDSIENNKKTYKQANSLSDIRFDTEYNIARKANTEDEVLQLETQVEVASLLKESISNKTNNTLLPANVGIENININSLINEHNTLLFQKNKATESAGKNNPIVIRLNSKLLDIKTNILSSVNTYKKQLESSLINAKKVNRKANGYFSSIPKKEKKLREIERQQSIKESLYLLLLQKREEAAISLAVTSPSIKVVDYAITSYTPINPKPKKTYALAVLLSLALPFIVLYIIFLANTKVQSRFDLDLFEKQQPIVTEIPFITGNKLFKGYYDNSILSEAFRVLRTNTQVALEKKRKKNNKGKVIYITSTIKGEGKTFTAVNLSLAFSALDKKVLLIGADYRNPQIHNYLNVSKKGKGLANYLKNANTDFKQLISKHTINELQIDVLLSGTVEKTAAELLSNGEFEDLICKSKQEYDYIIVDTAPTILVTDTLLIAKHADTTVYVIRSNYTDKKLINFSQELIESKRLINVNYLINSITYKNKNGYNYGYGYGYNANKKKKWFH